MKVKIIHFVSPDSPGIFSKYCELESSKSNIYEISSFDFTKSKYKYLSYLYNIVYDESDLFFIRYNLEISIIHFFALMILRLRFKKIIIEIPTPFFSHFKIHKSFANIINYYLIAPLNFILCTRIKKYANENGFLKIFNFKSDLVGNGIGSDSVKIKNKDNVIEDKVNFVFVATFAPWHGAEKLINFLRTYPQYRDNVVFHLVGDGVSVSSLKRLITFYGLESSFIFYGMLNRIELIDVYNNCQCAISSLSWDLIGVTEASPIKAREYLMAGLPFIYSTADPDFSSHNIVSYFLDCESFNLEFATLIDNFIKMKYTVSPMICHDYAKTNLIFDVKLNEFFSYN